jgi:hypothetical protein
MYALYLVSTTEYDCRMIFVGEADLDHTLSLAVNEVAVTASHVHV